MLRSTKTSLFKTLAGFALLTSTLAQADPTLVTGTPGDDLLASPSLPSPKLTPGLLISFDELTPFSTFASNTYATEGVSSITSPDGLVVEPFSEQSGPNYLVDTSADGSANITLGLSSGADAIGIGIADSDESSGTPVTIMLQALGKDGSALGAAFGVTIPEDTVTAGNGYFVVKNTAFDIYGLQITQPIGDAADFSGLAIDDVQVQMPEPSTWALCLLGIGAMFYLRRRSLRA